MAMEETKEQFMRKTFNDPAYAEIVFVSSPSQIVVWDTVLENSVMRHSDGTLFFKYRCVNDKKIRRVTLNGNYRIKYAPEE